MRLGFSAGIDVLDQRDVAPGFDLIGPALPPASAFARASSASMVAGDGHLIVRGGGEPRFDHDPVTGAALGLLIEPAGANLLTHSEGSAAQIDTRSGVVDAAQGFGGFAAAIRFSADNSVAQFAYKSFPSDQPGPWCLSVFVAMDDGAAPVVSGSRSTGDFTLVVGGATAAAERVVDRGGGIFRCHATLDARPDKANWGVVKYTGQSARGFRVAGYMLEAGARPTSYIRTGDAPEARAADMLTLGWAALGAGDGPTTTRYTFDDGSTEQRATIIDNGAAPVPHDLARAHIRRVAIA